MTRNPAVLALLFTLVVPFGSSFAQAGQSPFEGKPVYNVAKHDPEERLTLARKLIRLRNYQGAADLLEVALETNSSDMTVLNLLKTCYDQLKQFDRAELLMRRALELSPGSTGHRLSLAEFLAKQGRADSALIEYERVAQTMPLADENRQLLLIRSMLSVGLDSAVLVQIDRARTATGSRTAFGLERGSVLESRLKYVEAAREYLGLLTHDRSGQAARAEKELMDLLEFAESSQQVETVLLSYADSSTGIGTLMLLADYYTRARQYDQGFALAVRCDSMTGHTGFPLLTFLRQCRERQAWEQVARMGAHISSLPVEPGVVTEAEFANAAALVQLGRLEEAVACYDRLVAGAEHPQVAADALYGIGTIYLEYWHDYTHALTYFDSVVTHYPRGLSYLSARRSLPQCYLRSGDLERARTGFAVLTDERMPEETQEEARYYLGLIAFFEKRYDSASLQLTKLMVDFPRGYFVNDALSLSMVLSVAENSADFLDEFSETLFFKARGFADSTRSGLRAVIEQPGGRLADIALYELANLELISGDSAAALGAVDELIVGHPDSYYVPLGMKIKADVCAGQLATRQEARDLYRQLLESYPDYPFASEVRRKLRELEVVMSVG